MTRNKRGLTDIAQYITEYSLGNVWRPFGLAIKPRSLNLPITDNCNARCVMCDVWKEASSGELTVPELGNILGDRLFSRVRHVGISGGEPLLRGDLLEIVSEVMNRLPRLQSVSITSHGFLVRKHERLLPAIKKLCDSSGVQFTLNLSVDGTEQIHDRVRGVPGGWQRVTNVISIAESHGIRTQLQCTVSQLNVYNAAAVREFARNVGVEVIFRRAVEIARLDNEASVQTVALTSTQDSFFTDFLTSPRTLESAPSPARRLYYQRLARTIRSESKKRNFPCAYQNQALLLSSHGELAPCSVTDNTYGDTRVAAPSRLYFDGSANQVRRRLKAQDCIGCLHDQTGYWSPPALAKSMIEPTKVWEHLRLAARSLRLLTRLGLTLPVNVLAGIRPRNRQQASAPRRMQVLGCYGGEHVGDAAILGGVLIEATSVKSALVNSTRPDRTSHWVDQLETPGVHVGVRSASLWSIVAATFQTDSTCIAGGPLMDLPEVLARNVFALSLARLLGHKSSVVGVGWGPFKRRWSLWLAQAVVRIADEVSFRDSSALSNQTVPRSVRERASVRPDPAFTYLKGRIPRTTKSGCSAAKVVAVNVRPLWDRFLVDGADAAALQSRVTSAILESARTFPDIQWRLFAMNADEYGFSDLEPLRNLAALLSSENISCELLERELTIDELYDVVDGADLTIAMRFHAVVFSIAAGTPVLGVEYSDGPQGKVARLIEQTLEHSSREQVAWSSMSDLTSEVISAWISSLLLQSSREE